METLQKPILENNQGLLNVLVIEDSNSISTALGITENRDKELVILLGKALNETDTIVDAMVYISKEITHANELAYCQFQLGVAITKLKHLIK